MTAEPIAWTWDAVFDGLEWPLERWQLLTAAEDYGVSPGVCAELARIAQQPYHSLAELERALRLLDPGPSSDARC